MVNTTPAFRNWLKQSTNMKLSSDASVLRITHEGVTDLSSLRDFDKDSVESLPRACSHAIIAVVADPDNGIEAEPAVPASNISTVSVHRLTVAANASRYYRREFLELSQAQKDELLAWQKSSAGKKALKKRATGRGGNKREGDGNSSNHWKKKMKKAMKTPEGLAHIMSIMAEEEEKSSAYVSSLRSSLQSTSLPPVPAGAPPSAPPIQVGSVEATYSNLSTKVKLQSILKRKK